MRTRTFLLCGLVTMLTFQCKPSNSANILFFFGLSTYSHRLIAWPLVEALVERNHTITFFQTDVNKNPHPNVTEVNPKLLHAISDQVNFLTERLALGHRRLLFKVVHILPSLGIKFCEAFLDDPNVVKWMKNSKFDLIFIDALFNECAYGLAHLHKAKTIIFSTSHPFGFFSDALGFPGETATVPDLHFALDVPLRFIDRVWTTVSALYYQVRRTTYMFPLLETMLREKLDMPDMPGISELMANTSAVFANTHFSEELARSLPPNFISIGGMNCKEKSELKPIPKDIERFINKSGDDGFILVSFGSAAKISSAPKEVQEVFFRAFENVKLPIIWKWEGERPSGMPKNVMTVKWIPQQDILAHPKIRAFIFHGGLLSIHEATCHQVPLIVFPVFAEQDFNAERLHRTGRGIRLEISTITQKKLEDAISKILHDESYKRNIQEVSERFMDRPQKPVDCAVWWTEYILRQKDTSFMRPIGSHLTWYQLRLLDVWAFLATLIFVFTYILVKAGKCILTSIVYKGTDNEGKIKAN